MEKISFSYVSQIYAGTIARTLNYPQPWIKPDEYTGKVSIDVSFGLIIKTNISYRVDVELYFGEEKIEREDKPATLSDPIVAGTTSGNQHVSIENMSLTNITLKNDGAYRVRLSLHRLDDSNNSNSVIHETDCFFYLSKEWKIRHV
ncbi:hypothetical protein WMC13_004611 [Salmonella enterica]